MVEYLDVYDANEKMIGPADRNVVHAFGLWHKTVHCWLVWNNKLVFQRRAKNKDNGGKLYTTASGHVAAGEILEQAFEREISQEIGATIEKPILLQKGVYACDFTKQDGSPYQDRVFYNMFFAKHDGKISDFKFYDGEVEGLVAIDLARFVEWSKNPTGTIPGIEWDGALEKAPELTPDDFVLIGAETVWTKFGCVAKQIKEALDQTPLDRGQCRHCE